MQKTFSLLSLLLIILLILLPGCVNQQLGETLSGPGINAREAAIAIDNLMSDLLGENKDNYATYFTPEEYEEIYGKYTGSFGGVGVYLIAQEDEGYPLIVNTMKGRPADLSGVQPGDILLSIDDESTAFLDIDLVARMVKGEIGTMVKLEVYRPNDGTTQFISVCRGLIETESVNGKMLAGESGISYIAVYDFNNHTPEEFVKIFNQLNKNDAVKALVLDLRNNGGGSVEAAVDLASFFVPKGEVIFWQKKAEGMANYRSSSNQTLKLPLVCLQNGSSASASEMVIGAIKDHGLGVTLGETSFGKGITQLIYPLKSGAALRYTESKYFTPNKYDLHNKGIEPQIKIENKADFFPDVSKPDPKNDAQLQKAVEILMEQLDS